MPQIDHIMQNDSLAARLAKDHDYVRSLVGESVEQRHVSDGEPIGENILKAIGKFLASIPWEVWAVIGILLLAWLAVKISVKIGNNAGKKDYVKDETDGEADNIYDIDFDAEFNDAFGKGDYAALVRLVYLRTLRKLDEDGRVEWKIYKTPEQYVCELPLPEFRRMTWHFLRVRYGRYDASSELYEEMVALREAVEKGGES